ncbi:polysaccharide deacetylase family protein [Jeotgalibacillus sp. S-D1]|uniref:polysaccharide deacetylase family protein n=1 Tax=Jeotgalibacillus sp. S-D1 TaxID=2552189 RepID=UPI00140440CF|nr:polysaccharide deacetylase family protein [Jeotgalibacillus sp. S-D1]
MFKKISGFIIPLICLLVAGQDAMAVTYQVQPNDTLAKISDKYGVPEDDIANQNKLLSTMLAEGQTLEIPSLYKMNRDDVRNRIALKLGIPLAEVEKSKLKTINDSAKNGMIYMGDPSEKRIALTFDDGPEDTYTPEILDILKEKDVKATFFVTGQHVKEYPERLKQIHDDGHVIGNHTWDHPSLPDLSDKELNKTIKTTTQEIESITGTKPDLLRPPFGEIEDRQAKLLHSQGYRMIMWTADSKDWMGISAEEIVSRVKQDASPGVIALQHNYHASGDFETVKALPEIIDELRADGYEFVTVPTLIDE